MNEDSDRGAVRSGASRAASAVSAVSSAVAGPVRVAFDVGMDTVAWRDAGGRDVTVGQAVVEMLVDRLVHDCAQRVASEVDYADVAARVRERADAAVDERLGAVLDREVVYTDSYGNTKAEQSPDGSRSPVTLAELLAKQAREWLGAEHRDSSGYASRQRTTNLQHMISAALEKGFARELSAAMDAAKADAVAAVRDHAATLLSGVASKLLDSELRKAARAADAGGE